MWNSQGENIRGTNPTHFSEASESNDCIISHSVTSACEVCVYILFFPYWLAFKRGGQVRGKNNTRIFWLAYHRHVTISRNDNSSEPGWHRTKTLASGIFVAWILIYFLNGKKASHLFLIRPWKCKDFVRKWWLLPKQTILKTAGLWSTRMDKLTWR